MLWRQAILGSEWASTLTTCLPQPHSPPTGLPGKQVSGPGRRGLPLSSLNYLGLSSSYPETEPQARLTLPAATGAERVPA